MGQDQLGLRTWTLCLPSASYRKPNVQRKVVPVDRAVQFGKYTHRDIVPRSTGVPLGMGMRSKEGIADRNALEVERKRLQVKLLVQNFVGLAVQRVRCGERAIGPKVVGG